MRVALASVVIYVTKAWIGEIGDMAKHLHFRHESNGRVSLLGGNVKTDYPFVQVDLVPNLVEGKVVIPAFIPAAVIIGMFDLTEAAHSYGFQSGAKARQDTSQSQ